MDKKIEELLNKAKITFTVNAEPGQSKTNIDGSLVAQLSQLFKTEMLSIIGEDESCFPDLKGYQETNLEIETRNELRKLQRSTLEERR